MSRTGVLTVPAASARQNASMVVHHAIGRLLEIHRLFTNRGAHRGAQSCNMAGEIDGTWDASLLDT